MPDTKELIWLMIGALVSMAGFVLFIWAWDKMWATSHRAKPRSSPSSAPEFKSERK